MRARTRDRTQDESSGGGRAPGGSGGGRASGGARGSGQGHSGQGSSGQGHSGQGKGGPAKKGRGRARPQQNANRNRRQRRSSGGPSFWGEAGKLPEPRTDVRITDDPAAIPRSLGAPPLPGHEAIAEHYFTAVYDRAVATAGALAAAGGLIDPDALIDD